QRAPRAALPGLWRTARPVVLPGLFALPGDAVSADLAGALAELRADPPKIRKTKRAQYGVYAPLPLVAAAVRPRLAELDLSWGEQTLINEAGTFVLRWTMRHIKTGESESGDWPIGADDPQKAGSAVTYARRYSLTTYCGITPE